MGAAEITTFDPQTKRLFAVNNGSINKIDVFDFTIPTAPAFVKLFEVGDAPEGMLFIPAAKTTEW